jgi:competence protein ComEC
MHVAFLDVGQGDAAVVVTPRGRAVVIDAGPASAVSDAGRRVVVPYLARRGITAIDLLILSHAHRDHFGGATALATALPVGAVLEPGEPVADSAYLALLDTLASRNVRWRPLTTGDAFTLDGVAFRVLSPARRERTGDLNEDSVVLLVQFGAFSVLFPGDAGERTEAGWGREPLDADLLKVGHHGSATATSSGLLAAIHADAAVISLGRNRYGHPAPSTLGRLAAAGVPAWRTDREGTVNVTSDGHTFEVRGGRTAARYDARDPTPETPSCCIPPR